MPANSIFNMASNAHPNQTARDDSSGICATVTDYIEGYYTGDARRVKHSLRPHYLKHVIHGNIPIREKTRLRMVEDVGSEGAADIPQMERTEQISVNPANRKTQDANQPPASQDATYGDRT
jgi:hypothetical protein